MLQEDLLKAWFTQEVLPLERVLTQFIRRNWRNSDDIIDIRQDVYELAYNGAKNGLPNDSRLFLYAVARNHIINLARRAQIVSLDLVADLEIAKPDLDLFSAERQLNARDELRRVQAGLERLSPRCREVVKLRKVEGLSQKEVAERLGVTKDTVEQQLKMGMKALVDFMLGGSGKIQWAKFDARRERKGEK